MRNIVCSHPTHATRIGQPGFAAVLGARPNLPDGPDVTVPGLFCQACGDVFHANRIASTQAEMDARQAAFIKFRNATGLSAAEARALANLIATLDVVSF